MFKKNNLLSSGHQFSDNENLLKFRFVFLNVLILTVSVATLINYLVSIFGGIDYGPLFENALGIFLLVALCAFFLLRKKRSYYPYVVSIILFSSLFLFYFAVLTRPEDEFRLIVFFMAIFAAFVLLGRKYGVALSLFIVGSVLVLREFHDLALSQFALSTFFSFFTIFAVLLYYFFRKIESDAIEFQVLNSKLEANIKKETQQRKDQEIMLLHQSRMANMGEMLDSIAHQWRQPLMHINSILMNMDADLEKKQQTGSSLIRRIDDVAALTLHMSQTIEDFRGLFKLEKEQHWFSIRSVIDDVIALMKNRFNNISVEYKASGDDSIHGYKNELIQVIIILLSNAVEAYEKQDEQQDEKNRLIVISTDVSNERILIEVEDSAGGINSVNTADIFKPYFTTKDQVGGTGLGLYIAQIIVVQKMHGAITASNTPNGAIFSISLNPAS